MPQAAGFCWALLDVVGLDYQCRVLAQLDLPLRNASDDVSKTTARARERRGAVWGSSTALIVAERVGPDLCRH